MTPAYNLSDIIANSLACSIILNMHVTHINLFFFFGLLLFSDSQCHYKNKASTNGYSWPMLESTVDNHLIYSTDLFVNFNIEAQSTGCSILRKEVTSSSLPSWLKQHKEETERITISYKVLV